MLRRAAGLLLALLMLGVGALWTAQGLGVVGESPSEKDALWYGTVGPVLGGFGVALAYVIVRGTSSRDAGGEHPRRSPRRGGREG